jgi:hypothetical protein
MRVLTLAFYELMDVGGGTKALLGTCFRSLFYRKRPEYPKSLDDLYFGFSKEA